MYYVDRVAYLSGLTHCQDPESSGVKAARHNILATTTYVTQSCLFNTAQRKRLSEATEPTHVLSDVIRIRKSLRSSNDMPLQVCLPNGTSSAWLLRSDTCISGYRTPRTTRCTHIIHYYLIFLNMNALRHVLYHTNIFIRYLSDIHVGHSGTTEVSQKAWVVVDSDGPHLGAFT